MSTYATILLLSCLSKQGLNISIYIFRYVDVSTVDVDTSKLINGHIKSTGALFLEVSLFILSLSILHEHAGYS